ncbi:MAG: hypothetical protein HC828_18155 [Blastochloris sp.]|nr:hypothetical protein [Blastochloris sp.]
MSRDIHRHDDDADMDATFARRNDERYATLQRGRDWIGVSDTLPERLDVVRIALGQVQPKPESMPLERQVGTPELATIEQASLFDAPSAPPRRRPLRPQQPSVVQQLTLW